MTVQDDSLTAQELAQIDAEIRAERLTRQVPSERAVGVLLLIGGLIAWIFSVVLGLEKLALLENPDATFYCDINPFISCGNVMESWQASTFVLPNQFIGMTGYALVACIGALHLGGARLPRWVVLTVLGGLAAAFVYLNFLAISAIWSIHALCLNCMGIWVATAPMLFGYLARAIGTGQVSLGAPLDRFLIRARWILPIAWYAILALMIVVAFFNQWLVVLGL